MGRKGRPRDLEPPTPVGRADIEAKLRQIRDEVETTTDAARPALLTAGVAAAVVVLGVVYLLGRRRGRKRSTVVEIRRV